MSARPRRFHLEIQHHRAKPYGLIRSSYREGGKVKHSNHGRLSGLPLEQLKLLQAWSTTIISPNSATIIFPQQKHHNQLRFLSC
jgi:hypothetical protein